LYSTAQPKSPDTILDTPAPAGTDFRLHYANDGMDTDMDTTNNNVDTTTDTTTTVDTTACTPPTWKLEIIQSKPPEFLLYTPWWHGYVKLMARDFYHVTALAVKAAEQRKVWINRRKFKAEMEGVMAEVFEAAIKLPAPAPAPAPASEAKRQRNARPRKRPTCTNY
jgi:hypothetical protein